MAACVLLSTNRFCRRIGRARVWTKGWTARATSTDYSFLIRLSANGANADVWNRERSCPRNARCSFVEAARKKISASFPNFGRSPRCSPRDSKSSSEILPPEIQSLRYRRIAQILKKRNERNVVQGAKCNLWYARSRKLLKRSAERNHTKLCILSVAAKLVTKEFLPEKANINQYFQNASCIAFANIILLYALCYDWRLNKGRTPQ